jgi:hypothetical protein
MPHKRGIATDQLTNVLQVIQLGRKTGLLTVERGEGVQREEGEITFQQGHIMYVRSGQLEGMTALNWLRTWGPCRFVFENINNERSTEPIQELSPKSTTGSLSAIRSSLRDTHLTPTPQVAHTPPPLGNYTQRHQTGIQRHQTDKRFNQALHAATEPAHTQMSSNIPIPRRACPADEGLKLLSMANLSRHHRQCYLLIDGQRTLVELARLMKRGPEDVIFLLQDLTNIGIVQY